MSGHSKWASIKHKKGAADAKRGKIFTKIIKEIIVAARMGGGDPEGNPRLRTVILKARGANMPKDNIERAIKKGSGDQEGADFQEIRYEGYGPGGTAVMVDCMTDNRNRTVAEVRHAFTKFGGNLGADGSVSYMFRHVGTLSYPAGSDEDAVMEAAIDAGAEEIRQIISKFVLRDYRGKRDRSPEYTKAYFNLYQKHVQVSRDSNVSLRYVLEMILVSPEFLYRFEETKGLDAPYPVSGVELATRLSYFLWSTAPIEELLQLGRNGSLLEDDVLKSQIARMLNFPSHSKLTNSHPSWPKTLRRSVIFLVRSSLLRLR